MPDSKQLHSEPQNGAACKSKIMRLKVGKAPRIEGIAARVHPAGWSGSVHLVKKQAAVGKGAWLFHHYWQHISERNCSLAIYKKIQCKPYKPI